LTFEKLSLNSLNAKLNPICHLLALLGAHHIVHISRIRVKLKITKKVGQIKLARHNDGAYHRHLGNTEKI